jgi:uncharacterized protein YndB with AHSA1/START domain
MARRTFVYVTYIASRAETVWQALLDGEFTRQYWGHDNVSDWQPGSAWEHRRLDAPRSVAILGEVLEARPPHHLTLSWADPHDRARRERHTHVSFDIEPLGDMVRLTVTHAELEPGSSMERKVSGGWPRVLSSLKSLLETGRPLDTWRGWEPPGTEPTPDS